MKSLEISHVSTLSYTLQDIVNRIDLAISNSSLNVYMLEKQNVVKKWPLRSLGS